MRQPCSERNRLRTVLLKKTAGEKSSSKLAQFFRLSFLAAASLAENMTLLALLTILHLVSIRDTYTTLSEKIVRENFISPKCAPKKIRPQMMQT